MKFKKVTKTLCLGDYHPDLEGVKFKLWLNPPRRLFKRFFSGDQEGFVEAITQLLGLEDGDVDEMPGVIMAALIGNPDHRGLVWKELDAYREELLKNFDGGSSSSKTE